MCLRVRGRACAGAGQTVLRGASAMMAHHFMPKPMPRMAPSQQAKRSSWSPSVSNDTKENQAGIRHPKLHAGILLRSWTVPRSTTRPARARSPSSLLHVALF